VDGVDRLIVDVQATVAQREGRPRRRQGGVARHVDLVAHQAMVRLDLPGELDLAATERSAGTKRAAPRAIESEQLPDPVDAEAAGLHGIAAEVAGEIPIVRAHLALCDPAATRPSPADLHPA